MRDPLLGVAGSWYISVQFNIFVSPHTISAIEFLLEFFLMLEIGHGSAGVFWESRLGIIGLA
jgi:hypothetical protein